jgi:4-hydroxybenzoate polyprenyltransferase
MMLLPNFFFVILVISSLFIAAGGYVINDYFDTKIDRENKPDKIIVGRVVKRRVAMVLHLVFNGIGIALALVLAILMHLYWLALIQIGCAVILWYYSTRFKHQPIIGNLIIALLAALVPFVVVLYEVLLHDPIRVIAMFWVLGFSLFAFMTNFIREIIKDMEDIKGDSTHGSLTLPVKIGILGSKKLLILLFLTTILALVYFQVMFLDDVLSTCYFFLMVHVPMFMATYKVIIGNDNNDFHAASNLMKLVMVGGVLYGVVIKYNFFN